MNAMKTSQGIGVSRIEGNTFAAACYDMNSIAELEESLQGDADRTDCENWSITPGEWRSQIELALAAKRADLDETIATEGQ
jgi:hypothetical protein